MNLTDAAKGKVLELISEQKKIMPDRDLFLRVAVQPGGCSGLRYQTYFDYGTNLEDTVINYDGFDLRVDKMSSPYLDGATMDYVESIDKIGFTIDNPNAQGSCACGDSFN